MKSLGIISIVLAIAFSLLSLISGIGVMGSFIALIISGISSIKGNFNYVIIVSILMTLNLSLFSVISVPMVQEKQIQQTIELPEIQGMGKTTEINKSAFLEFARVVIVPYFVTFLFVLIGINQRKKHITKKSS